MRLEAQVAELRIGRVVVVALRLDAGVREVLDLDRDVELGGRALHEVGQLRDRELLGELVEDPELAQVGRVGDRELHALKSVADVQEAARLPTLAVDGQRVADHRLHAEAVEDGPEVLVVVEAGDEAVVGRRLVGLDPVDDALVQVGGAQAPDPAGEVDVVRVVDLREVVERAGELRERQDVGAALVVDLDEPLLDVDVGGPVLAHRPELHQVAIRHLVADRPEQVEGADHVRVLGLDRGVAGAHRVRRRRLLRVVDDRLGDDLVDHPVDERRVLHRADVDPDLPPPETSRHAATRSSSDAIGVSESVEFSVCQRRREKLSTIETSWPRAEKRIAVGQPRYPSPPRIRIRIGARG